MEKACWPEMDEVVVELCIWHKVFKNGLFYQILLGPFLNSPI